METDGGGADADPSAADAGAQADGAPARAACNSLYAAAVAETAGVDCDTPAPPDGVNGCTDGETPNACAQRLYDEAPTAVGFLPPEDAPRKSPGFYLPRCAGGGDDCPGQEVRCYDGTRPVVYAQKAHETDHGPMTSNVWIISLGGEGGPCVGDDCWQNYYLPEADELPFRNSLTTRGPWDAPPKAEELEDGILEDAPLINGRDNPFHHTNRLRFERCSEWASDGEAIIQPAATHPGPTTVYHHGERIAVTLFNSLTTDAGRAVDDLPSLADATLIVLTGSSDGAKWLALAADRLAAELAGIAPGAVVAVVIDSTLTPLLENEYRRQYPFDSLRDVDGSGDNGIYDHILDNPDGLLLPQAIDGDVPYGMGTYQEGGVLRTAHDALAIPLDASCAAAHAADVSPCYDHGHVMLNHLSTPYMLVGDLIDPTANSAAWGGTAQPWLPQQMAPRMRDQLVDVVTLAAEHAGCGDDSAEGYTPAVWMPSNHRHTQVLHADRVATRMYMCAGTDAQGFIDLGEAMYSWLIGGERADAIAGYTPPSGLTWRNHSDCTD
jgi:hypothetical protein